MVKPPVGLAFLHEARFGAKIYGPKSRRKMYDMLVRSDNNATNFFMQVLGGPSKVERILKKNYGSIFEKTEIVEFIKPGYGPYRNKAPAEESKDFLLALMGHNSSVGFPSVSELRRNMKWRPGKNERVYRGTSIPRRTEFYNKTGSTGKMVADMAYVNGRGVDGNRYPYIFVGIVQKSSRASSRGQLKHWYQFGSKIISRVSDLMYKEMKKDYRLV